MYKCVSCYKYYTTSQRQCPHCGYIVEKIDGFHAYAPPLQDKINFSVSAFNKLAEFESKNFWFISRNKLIVFMLNKYIPDMYSFMEVGCGTGFVLSGIAENFPGVKLTGCDAFTQGLAFAKTRVPHASLLQIDAKNIPFYDEFDAIGAFDVLEHIEDDFRVITEIYGALHKGGLFIATVPQHMRLWSMEDERACHVRRYVSGELENKIVEVGFRILETTSFVTLLLPIMWLSRKIMQRFYVNNQNDDAESMREFSISPCLNSIFGWTLSVERFGIKCGFRYPCGGSRLVVAQK